MRIPLLAFIIIPISELLLLFEVADLIGAGYTLLLVILTAFIGVSVLRRQGFSTLRRADARLQSGQLPAQEIVEGMLLAFAGALLLTPGFITDTIGFLCLTPAIRSKVAQRILRSGSGFFMAGFGGGGFSAGAGFRASSYRGNRSKDSADSDIIDGEYSNEDDSRGDPRIDPRIDPRTGSDRGPDNEGNRK
ncbi:MAG: FxsA family protein [Pseudomonadales bacterium]|nr:FxsA family protein [Pseudomonadales bacterium]